MSDSSEEEDLSRFKEAVDTSFTKLINDAKNKPLNGSVSQDAAKPKSERYLDISSHYNDVKMPEQLQKQIGAKISTLINKNIEFVDVPVPEKPTKKKRKTKGGVKLFKDSSDYLTGEEAQDTYTEGHNRESKKIKKTRRKIDSDDNDLNESGNRITFGAKKQRSAREERTTSEISLRALQRKEWDPLDVSDTEFQDSYRLTKEAFLFLCDELRQKTALKSSQRVDVKVKVLSALSFYATGSYQRLVGMGQYLGQSTVSKFLKEVTNALITPAMLNAFITFPVTRAQRDTIKNKFYSMFGFPGVIGCIDGCHFHIIMPNKEEDHLYYCRELFFSLNVQMICDSDCRILNLNPKFGGATDDAFVWEFSKANEYMQELHRNNEQVWLLGDPGYPQRPWLMTPVTDAVEGSPAAIYNTVHGKARVVIENTFRRLKNRWRCLCKDRTLHYAPEKCAKIITACSVLHNIAINYNIPEPEESDESDESDSTSTQQQHIFEENSNGDDLVQGRVLRNLIIERIHSSHV